MIRDGKVYFAAGIWPFMGAFSALALFGGAVMWMHGNEFGPYVTGAGLIAVRPDGHVGFTDRVAEIACLLKASGCEEELQVRRRTRRIRTGQPPMPRMGGIRR